jgi:hypothetical protein
MQKETPGMCKMNKRHVFGVLLLVAPLTAGAETLPQVGLDKHMGVATCAASQCHGSAIARDGSNVLQNEYVTWTQNDPHANAYQTLTTDASIAIAARLGLRSASTATMCLDCHADNAPLDKRGERFQISDGVGCEGCHGGAERWLSTHYNVPAITHSDSLTSGLYPTDRIADRATLCLSCHLGTEDKFATHRIMAAGHPRLSFELDTFVELWRTAGRQPHYRVDDDYRERKSVSSHSLSWAAGLVVEGRQRLRLVMDPEFTGSGMFPELGLYDCHACHRSMKTVQWRALSRHGGVGPGVPFLTDGTFVMIQILARSFDIVTAESIEKALTALHIAGASTAAEIRAAASELDAEFAKLQRQLSAQKTGRRERQILNHILEAGAAAEFIDYASAEQAFMAVQMLAFELQDVTLQGEIDELASALENDEGYRPAQFSRLLRNSRQPN